jgi:hypothetical protein
MTADGKTEDEISALLLRNELALLDPSVRSDRRRVLALLTEDFEEIGSSGRVWTRDNIVEELAAETYDPPALSDFCCRLIAPGVALVTYRTIRTMRTNAATGAQAAANRSSLWIFQDGQWRARFHQGTPAA